mmetsp:Transcript_25109/g.51590  ORF Transcript_25109/g.51590 Transcript_25109/m.51590 type:complete len:220 (-) Transcript_25109:1276-1935(-)
MCVPTSAIPTPSHPRAAKAAPGVRLHSPRLELASSQARHTSARGEVQQQRQQWGEAVPAAGPAAGKPLKTWGEVRRLPERLREGPRAAKPWAKRKAGEPSKQGPRRRLREAPPWKHPHSPRPFPPRRQRRPLHPGVGQRSSTGGGARPCGPSPRASPTRRGSASGAAKTLSGPKGRPRKAAARTPLRTTPPPRGSPPPRPSTREPAATPPTSAPGRKPR